MLFSTLITANCR